MSNIYLDTTNKEKHSPNNHYSKQFNTTITEVDKNAFGAQPYLFKAKPRLMMNCVWVELSLNSQQQQPTRYSHMLGLGRSNQNTNTTANKQYKNNVNQLRLRRRGFRPHPYSSRYAIPHHSSGVCLELNEHIYECERDESSVNIVGTFVLFLRTF